MTGVLSDVRLTNLLAQGSGEILKGIRGVGLLRDKELAQAGDELAQNWIARVLAQHRPDDGFYPRRPRIIPRGCRKTSVDCRPARWHKEFATGRQDWAVHIALVEDGVPLHAAVGLPDLGVVFRSSEVRAVSGPFSRRIVVSRNRPPEIADYVGKHMDLQTVRLGSAGAKAMKVLLGDVDAYIHSGGQYEWDQAAPVGVAQAAGLHVSRLDGSQHQFNRADTYIPDLLICRKELADDMLGHIADYKAANGRY